jgi:hypothetical protein
METVGEVAAASVFEVTVKEPKQISTGLARCPPCSSGRRHQIGPPWCTARSRSPLPGVPTVKGETWQIRKVATHAVVG